MSEFVKQVSDQSFEAIGSSPGVGRPEGICTSGALDARLGKGSARTLAASAAGSTSRNRYVSAGL